MLEFFAYLILASSAVMTAAVLLNLLNIPKSKSLVFSCYPVTSSSPSPDVLGGHVTFLCPYDLIVAQSSAESGWTQEVDLQHRVKIPHGYAGVLSVAPFSFRTDNGRSHSGVVSEPEFFPSGWEGDLRIILMNRHPEEPAICDRGSPIANLLLVPTDSEISLRSSIG